HCIESYGKSYNKGCEIRDIFGYYYGKSIVDTVRQLQRSGPINQLWREEETHLWRPTDKPLFRAGSGNHQVLLQRGRIARLRYQRHLSGVGGQVASGELVPELRVRSQ